MLKITTPPVLICCGCGTQLTPEWTHDTFWKVRVNCTCDLLAGAASYFFYSTQFEEIALTSILEDCPNA